MREAGRPPRSPLGPALDREAGLDPVLLAALVVRGVLVACGRQLTDDPRRGVSVEVRAVGDDLGGPVRREPLDLVPALVPDRARQVLPVVRSLAEHLQEHGVVPALHLLLEFIARYGLHP